MFGELNKTEIVGDELIYTFTLKGREQFRAFKEWLDAHPNEFKPMWVPTMQKELVLVAGPDRNKLTVRPQKNYRGKRDIAIIHTDESKDFRHIDSVETKPNGEQVITLNEEVSAVPIREICCLWLCRPVYNQTVIEWDGAETTRQTLRFIDMAAGSS